MLTRKRTLLKNQTNNERTTLDYLNEDCWREVLSYVPVQDIVQSERVSRRWQRVVLTYLQGIRFSFNSIDEDFKETPPNAVDFTLKTIVFTGVGVETSIDMYNSFASWTTKLGSAVVSIYCTNEESLKVVKENCPNIESLTFLRYYEPESKTKKRIPRKLNEDFNCLKRLCFDKCHPSPSDDFVSQYTHKALEDLYFYHCYTVTGRFLTSANLSNIKSLKFNTCLSLEAPYIVASAKRLIELTKLVLVDVPTEIAKKIQSVLDKMPKLEWLEIHSYKKRHEQCSLNNFAPLCCVNHLKYLELDLKVTDNSVEAVTRCCKELNHLELWNCEDLSTQGLDAICRNAGDRLTELGLHYYRCLEDENVVNCVRRCPELTMLTLGGTSMITQTLPSQVTAARNEVRPEEELCLDITETEHIQDIEDSDEMEDEWMEDYDIYDEMEEEEMEEEEEDDEDPFLLD